MSGFRLISGGFFLGAGCIACFVDLLDERRISLPAFIAALAGAAMIALQLMSADA